MTVNLAILDAIYNTIYADSILHKISQRRGIAKQQIGNIATGQIKFFKTIIGQSPGIFLRRDTVNIP